MNKEIKDYLYLYFGCECESAFIGKKMRLVGITKTSTNEYGEYVDSAMVEFWINGKHECRPCSLRSIKPILRPLSDMTEEEKKEINSIDDHALFELGADGAIGYILPDVFRYILSHHFDIFGLISSGVAIDKTTLNQKP